MPMAKGSQGGMGEVFSVTAVSAKHPLCQTNSVSDLENDSLIML